MHQNGNFEFHCKNLEELNLTTYDKRMCQGVSIQGINILTGQTGTSFEVTCGRYKNSCRDGIIHCAQGLL